MALQTLRAGGDVMSVHQLPRSRQRRHFGVIPGVIAEEEAKPRLAATSQGRAVMFCPMLKDVAGT